MSFLYKTPDPPMGGSDPDSLTDEARRLERIKKTLDIKKEET